VLLVERFNRFEPGFTLTVVDLSEIQHVPVHHASARQAPLLHKLQ
jgi:hypothetical protein